MISKLRELQVKAVQNWEDYIYKSEDSLYQVLYDRKYQPKISEKRLGLDTKKEDSNN